MASLTTNTTSTNADKKYILPLNNAFEALLGSLGKETTKDTLDNINNLIEILNDLKKNCIDPDITDVNKCYKKLTAFMIILSYNLLKQYEGYNVKSDELAKRLDILEKTVGDLVPKVDNNAIVWQKAYTDLLNLLSKQMPTLVLPASGQASVVKGGRRRRRLHHRKHVIKHRVKNNKLK